MSSTLFRNMSACYTHLNVYKKFNTSAFHRGAYDYYCGEHKQDADVSIHTSTFVPCGLLASYKAGGMHQCAKHKAGGSKFNGQTVWHEHLGYICGV